MENTQRNLYNIASDIDDVIIGIERAEKAVYMVFENYHSDVHELISSSTASRFEDYETSLSLSTDRISDEKKKLETLVKELYDFHKELKRRREVCCYE